MNNIQWKPVLGYEGFYEVSYTGGMVKSLVRPHRRKETVLKNKIQTRTGHHYVRLLKNDKTQVKKYIHVLVLEAFGFPRPFGLECRHLDGNPKNNDLSNLKWGTHSENMQDSMKHGTFNYVGLKGEKHSCAKLTDKDVIEIKCILKTGSMKNKDIAKKYGVVHGAISNIKNNRTWKHIMV